MALFVSWTVSVVLALMLLTDVPRRGRRQVAADVVKTLLALFLLAYALAGASLLLLL